MALSRSMNLPSALRSAKWPPFLSAAVRSHTCNQVSKTYMRTRCDSNTPVGADLLHEPGGRPFVCCCALTHLHTDTERATYSEIFGWCLTRQARWPPFLSAAVRSHTCARTSPKQSLREVIGRWVQSSLAFMRACKCLTEQARWPSFLSCCCALTHP
jgi:hypothetical protein